jgi:hypothetical protein
MAPQDEQCLDCLDLQALPAPALQAVVSAIGAKGGLLRTSSVCRDAVLAACKLATLRLHVNKDEQLNRDEQLKAHQPLLQRACATAAPGLKLWLEAEAYGSQHRGTLPLDGLLESVAPFHLPNVHKLTLQVTTHV